MYLPFLSSQLATVDAAVLGFLIAQKSPGMVVGEWPSSAPCRSDRAVVELLGSCLEESPLPVANFDARIKAVAAAMIPV